MRLLIIGGTGTISTAVVQETLNQGHDVTVLNRGNHLLPQGVEQLIGDIRDEAAIADLLKGRSFDAVGDFSHLWCRSFVTESGLLQNRGLLSFVDKSLLQAFR